MQFLRVASLSLLFALAACAADRHLGEAERACAAASVLDEIDCTKRQLAGVVWRDKEVAETVRTYLAYADRLAEQVRAGRISNLNAKQDLHILLQRLRSDIQSGHPYSFNWLWPA